MHKIDLYVKDIKCYTCFSFKKAGKKWLPTYFILYPCKKLFLFLFFSPFVESQNAKFAYLSLQVVGTLKILPLQSVPLHETMVPLQKNILGTRFPESIHVLLDTRNIYA